MARHISTAYSGCQEEESRDPTECFCSSDEAALRRLSWLQHQKRGAGSCCCARSTGRSEPGVRPLSMLAARLHAGTTIPTRIAVPITEV